jgi:hypothetical protein
MTLCCKNCSLLRRFVYHSACSRFLKIYALSVNAGFWRCGWLPACCCWMCGAAGISEYLKNHFWLVLTMPLSCNCHSESVGCFVGSKPGCCSRVCSFIGKFALICKLDGFALIFLCSCSLSCSCSQSFVCSIVPFVYDDPLSF